MIGLEDMDQLLRCAERTRERPADVRRREMLREFDQLINHKVIGEHHGART